MDIAITGAGGRMGQMLVRQIAKTPGARLITAIEAPGSNLVGRDAGELAGIDAAGVRIIDDAAEGIAAAKVVIDFTVPSATTAHAVIAAQKGVGMVIGTTGLDAAQTKTVHETATKVPVMWAANMSLGVNILLALVDPRIRVEK